MGLACSTSLHRHPPILQPCDGCHRRVCGPDDVLHTQSGAVRICAGCWERWRGSGYRSTVTKAEKVARIAAMDRAVAGA
jgi:hypothetical protein